MHHHKWQMEYIDNLMPWEKEIYVSMLAERLKEKKEAMEKNRQ